jgi:hypothetical protein
LLEDWEERCRLLSCRAEKKLEGGNYKGAIGDLKLAHEVLRGQEESFEQRRSELKRRYFWSYFCCLCTGRQAQME